MGRTSQILTQTGTVPVLGPFQQSSIGLSLRTDNNEILAPTQVEAGQGCEAIINGDNLIVSNPTSTPKTLITFRATHQHSSELPEEETPVAPGDIAAPVAIPDADGNIVTGQAIVDIPALAPIPAAPATVPLTAPSTGPLAGQVVVAANRITLGLSGIYKLTAKLKTEDTTNNLATAILRQNPVGAPATIATLTTQGNSAGGETSSRTDEKSVFVTLSAADVLAGLLNVFDLQASIAVGASGSILASQIVVEKVG